MKTRTLIAMFVAATVGLVVLAFVAISSDSRPTISITSNVTNVQIVGRDSNGTKQSSTACTEGQDDCLPKLTYVDTQGNSYSPESLKGKVVVVNFWATWCRPCQVEIPAFSKTYDRYKDQGVVFLGILKDNTDDQSLLNFSNTYELTYPVVRATPEIDEAYAYPNALPTTMIFDHTGKRKFERAGALHESTLTNQLDTLLAQRSI